MFQFLLYYIPPIKLLVTTGSWLFNADFIRLCFHSAGTGLAYAVSYKQTTWYISCTNNKMQWHISIAGLIQFESRSLLRPCLRFTSQSDFKCFDMPRERYWQHTRTVSCRVPGNVSPGHEESLVRWRRPVKVTSYWGRSVRQQFAQFLSTQFFIVCPRQRSSSFRRTESSRVCFRWSRDTKTPQLTVELSMNNSALQPH